MPEYIAIKILRIPFTPIVFHVGEVIKGLNPITTESCLRGHIIAPANEVTIELLTGDVFHKGKLVGVIPKYKKYNFSNN